MKRIITILLATVVYVSAFAAPVAKAGKGATSFAVFTDETTYNACRDAFDAYKKALDAEGLGTYIYAQGWNSPDEIKDIIRSLVSDKKQPLEGAVFVGDVPVVMVRGGQHLTTAFKMDEERFPIFQSSVASDRFYDDLDLDFEFIQKDTAHANTFYYKLTEQGAQTLRPDIYSARIKVPQFMIDAGSDPYSLISDFLFKAAKAHSEPDVLDNMSYFFGSSYNSEDMNAWRERSFAYGDVFPNAYEKASTHRFLNFHQSEEMKWTLFSELQRPDVDFFQFSEHGAADTQYITRWDDRPTLERDLLDIKAGISSMLDKASYDSLGHPHFKYPVLDSVYMHFIPGTFSDSLRTAYQDELDLYEKNKDISQQDIAAIHTNARFVVLNACYNGSYHDPEGYVAGAHIFNGGRCMVVQGNTVNVLQDKIEDKLIGYLSLGLRAGMWHKEVPYLEEHLIGDPTFRFAPAAVDKDVCAELQKALLNKNADKKTWEAFLSSSNATVREAAVVHLGYLAKDGKANEASVAGIAQNLLENDPATNVRMSAFTVLTTLDVKYFEKAFLTAVKDPYELIVRQAFRAAQAYGSEGTDGVILKTAKAFMGDHPELIRANFYTETLEELITGDGWLMECLDATLDKGLTDAKRINGLRYFRNNRYIPAIPAILDAMNDASSSEMVRVVAAEALGWYDMSAAKNVAIDGLKSALSSGSLPDAVRKEAEKSLKRLQ